MIADPFRLREDGMGSLAIPEASMMTTLPSKVLQSTCMSRCQMCMAITSVPGEDHLKGPTDWQPTAEDVITQYLPACRVRKGCICLRLSTAGCSWTLCQ